MSKKKLHRKRPKTSKSKARGAASRRKYNSCTRKIGYTDKKEAHEMKRFHNEGLTVYKCKLCGKFHIGHKK